MFISFKERQERDEKIKRELLDAADKMTALGNATEQLLSCVRALTGNLRAERPRFSGADLAELIKCYEAVILKREPVAQAIQGIRRAQQEATERDESVIDEAMERAGLSALLALEALKGKKNPSESG